MPLRTLMHDIGTLFALKNDYATVPFGLAWRSHTIFILSTIGMGLFTDMFLYGLAVPILPFLLSDRIHVPQPSIQTHVSWLLAAYAAASFVFSPVAGIVADKTESRQAPFLAGLAALTLSTVLLFLAQSVWLLAIARVLQGISGAVVWTVGLALCVDTVGPNNLGKAIGTIFSFVSVGALFAPILGGVLYKVSGLGAVAALSLGLLGVDFVMRVLVIEKKVAARYPQVVAESDAASTSSQPSPATPVAAAPSADNAPSEDTPLLRKPSTSSLASTTCSASSADIYLVKPSPTPSVLERYFPLIQTLHHPSLRVTFFTTFAQSLVFGAFDATVPIQGNVLFGFDALQAGLLFAPLAAADMLVGPLAGWAVDRYGTKPVAVLGYALLVPALAALRLPHAAPQGSPDAAPQIALLVALLAVCGMGVAITGSPGLVESGRVVERFAVRNHGAFGKQGPFAQLYALNSMVFCVGLSVGPVVAGWLTEGVGFGNMNAVLAVLCAGTSLVCWVWMGGRPGLLRRWDRWRRTRRAKTGGEEDL